MSVILRENQISIFTESALPDRDFDLIRTFIFDIAGIDLGESKKMLVTARLSKRLRHYGLKSFGEYFNLATNPEHPGERQMMVDLLTTNETYFFREPGHFEFMKNVILDSIPDPNGFRVWSAASSTGQECYSIAMILAEQWGLDGWELLGSDISQRVIQTAVKGHYSMARTDGIPPDYLKKYCLRGTGPQDGTLLIDKKLRQKVRFLQINLNKSLPEIGVFDLVFLRNILIYFDTPTKQQIIGKVLSTLKPGGYLFIGHSESLNGVNDSVTLVAPTTYCKSLEDR